MVRRELAQLVRRDDCAEYLYAAEACLDMGAQLGGFSRSTLLLCLFRCRGVHRGAYGGFDSIGPNEYITRGRRSVLEV